MSLKEFFLALQAGWQQYTESGMYIGVFFAALVFLWLVCYNKFSKDVYKGKRILFFYAVGITGLVLFPVSAFVLLKYQSSFFTYSQLFLMIPIIPVIAWGMTEFITWVGGYVPAQKDTPEVIKRKPWICEVAALVVLVAVLWMAGSLSFGNEVTAQVTNDAKIPDKVLEVLRVLETDEDIELDTDVILATDEILEYARLYNGDMKLLYGRNMWQPVLNAYTYDTYPEEWVRLHRWLNTTVHGMEWIDANITVEEAFGILENSECTVLVLKRIQFEENEIAQALAGSDFAPVAEAGDYVILKK